MVHDLRNVAANATCHHAGRQAVFRYQVSARWIWQVIAHVAHPNIPNMRGMVDVCLPKLIDPAFVRYPMHNVQ